MSPQRAHCAIRSRVARVTAAALAALLGGCGGDSIYVFPPANGSPLFKDDVVVVGLPPENEMPWAARDGPVECYFRPVGSGEFARIRMERLLHGMERPLYAAHLPGAARGDVEYYFMYTNSNLVRARVPRDGLFPGRSKGEGRAASPSATGSE